MASQIIQVIFRSLKSIFCYICFFFNDGLSSWASILHLWVTASPGATSFCANCLLFSPLRHKCFRFWCRYVRFWFWLILSSGYSMHFLGWKLNVYFPLRAEWFLLQILKPQPRVWKLATPMWEVSGALDDLHIQGQRPGSGTLITSTLALKNHEEANSDGHWSKDSVWCKYPCFYLKSCEDIKLVWSKERWFGLWEIILFLMGVAPAPMHEWSGQACSTPSISTVQVDGQRWAGDKRCLVLMVMCDEVPLREISKPRLWHAWEIWTRLGQIRTCENPFSYCFHIIVWFVHLYSSSWGGGSWHWLLSSALFWQCCLLTLVIWSFDIYTHTFLTWSTGCGVELWY